MRRVLPVSLCLALAFTASACIPPRGTPPTLYTRVAEVEPNDTVPEAQVLPNVPAVEVLGEFSSDDSLQPDRYRIPAAEGGNVVVAIDCEVLTGQQPFGLFVRVTYAGGGNTAFECGAVHDIEIVQPGPVIVWLDGGDPQVAPSTYRLRFAVSPYSAP
jgi:hypothetical protein